MITKSSVQIRRADPNKEPLRVNVFSSARTMNTQLCPMFPYLSDGDMVPAVTVFYGGPGRDNGAFTHTNTADEVYIMFGIQGAPVRAGDVIVGGREHIVSSFLDNPYDPDSLMTVVVVQRQAEQGVPQTEAVTYFCEKCQNPLLVHRFDARDKAPEGANPGYQVAFKTLLQSATMAEDFNKDEGTRTCKKCGHLNACFPLDIWGWQTYRARFSVQERCRARYFDEIAAAERTQ